MFATVVWQRTNRLVPVCDELEERTWYHAQECLITLALLLLIAAAPLLGACNTTAGAGQDLSATGHAITNSAEQHKP